MATETITPAKGRPIPSPLRVKSRMSIILQNEYLIGSLTSFILHDCHRVDLCCLYCLYLTLFLSSPSSSCFCFQCVALFCLHRLSRLFTKCSCVHFFFFLNFSVQVSCLYHIPCAHFVDLITFFFSFLLSFSFLFASLNLSLSLSFLLSFLPSLLPSFLFMHSINCLINSARPSPLPVLQRPWPSPCHTSHSGSNEEEQEEHKDQKECTHA